MKRSNWKFKLWMWWSLKIIRIPYVINFNDPEDPDVYGVGFAWTERQALDMRGDEALRQEIIQLKNRIGALSGSRSGRRIMNRAAKRAAGIKK